MSTILKALDRLERERGSRSASSGPEGLPPGAPAPPPGRRGRAALGVAAALVAGAALGAGFLALWPAAHPGTPAPAAPVAVAAPGPVAPAVAPELPPPEVTAAATELSDAAPASEPEPEPTGSEPAVEAELPAVPPGPEPELAAAPHELPTAALRSEVAVVEPRAERVPVSREPSDEAPVAVVAPPPPAARSAEHSAPPPAARSPERAAPPPAVPDFSVARTVWHPLPERRLAVVELRGERGVRELREGDRLGPLRVREIDPSSVLFELDGKTLRRRVGGS